MAQPPASKNNQAVDFSEGVERALSVRAQYADLKQTRYGRLWKNDEIALGFMGDVGDLARLMIAQNGVRDIAEAREKLAHKLSDCR